MLFGINGLFEITDEGDNAENQYQQAKCHYGQAALGEYFCEEKIFSGDQQG